ncbi:hypothetical protein [Streptomyces sp. TLI_171]|uniref:hypothetical protein n=1 Tax=Streptomyces sp. TLI_171 TaxID=1938859 RepID=UPI000C198008|nr:hypothetical protein [Streptomyces sp. TLI_171]RKE20314.1 hypothetical protein BX266_3668 [Streptomyces sp. TLI_171]
MSMEAALLESRTLRSGLCERTEVLDEVKALVPLPDGLHVTTRMVADYFDVGENIIRAVVRRHREELRSNGYTVVKPVDDSAAAALTPQPVDNPENQSYTKYFWQVSRSQGGGNGVALYSRRAVLNVAMLLRDSEVARRVRARLLDIVEAAAHPVVEPPVVHPYRARPWKRWSELRWDEYEAGRRDPAVEAWRRRIDGLDPYEPELPWVDGEEEVEYSFPAEDLPAVVSGLAVSVGVIERRLDAQGVLIAAIGERISRQEARLDGLGEGVRAIRRDVAHLRGRRRRRG